MWLIAIGFISFFYLIVIIIEKKKKTRKNVQKINPLPSIEKHNEQINSKKDNLKPNQDQSQNRVSTERTNKNNSTKLESCKQNYNDTIRSARDPKLLDNDHNSNKLVKHKSEEECRVIIESIFNYKFPTTRPDFLKNPLSNKNLELDCYCEELGIALEYNGIQHYTYPNPFHKNEDEFKKQLQRDEYKKKMCRVNDVLLIIIPYNMKKKMIRQYIIDRYNERLK